MEKGRVPDGEKRTGASTFLYAHMHVSDTKNDRGDYD